jgi:hypothetical protein
MKNILNLFRWQDGLDICILTFIFNSLYLGLRKKGPANDTGPFDFTFLLYHCPVDRFTPLCVGGPEPLGGHSAYSSGDLPTGDMRSLRKHSFSVLS